MEDQGPAIKASRHAEATVMLELIQQCHSTDYGLMCDRCKGEIRAYRTWEVGEIYDNPF